MLALYRYAVLCICLSLCTSLAAEEDISEVLIGYVAPLADPDAASGRNAARMAIDEANAGTPRIAGKRIQFKLLEQDDRADQRTAEQIARYLVKTPVVAVVGHWTSTTSIAAAPIYAEANLPQIAPIAWSRQYSLLTNRNKFQGVGSDDVAMQYAVNYLIQNEPLKRLMVIDDSALLGVSMANSFQNYATKAGLKIQRESVSTQTSDFNAPLTLAKQSNPDLIFFTGRFAQSAAVARNVQRLHIASKLLLTGPIVTQEFLDNISGSNVGIYSIVPGIPMENSSKSQTFKSRYSSRFDAQPAPFALFAYDNVLTLVAAIKQADSLEKKSIIEALYRVRYAGISGQISFNQDGTLEKPSYTLYEAENGKWKVRKIFK